MGAESTAIGDVLETIQHLRVRPEVGHPEWHDDHPCAGSVVCLDVRADALLRLGPAVRPVLAERLAADVDERPDLAKSLGAPPHVGQPSLILGVIAGPMLPDAVHASRMARTRTVVSEPETLAM